ncbi:MAG: aldo/keto reductase [Gammaproteobacteria bacterium]|nr:aldo/keto reductase [Gammaproteobacteria bacterium]
MKLSRRQVIAAGAGAGAYVGFGLGAAAFAAGETPITKLIPSSGEALPVIGIGTNRWVAGGSPAEAQAFRDVLKVFRDGGGRVVDTAPSYRTSEEALGTAIDELGFRDAFFLATKVDRSEKQDGIARMNDSLVKLQRESMDLIQVHNLRGARVQLETLLEWRESGRIRYAGITTSRVSQHAEMEALMREYPLDFVQVNYSLQDRAAEERILPLAEEKGIATLINLPFARGKLFKAVKDQAVPDWATEFNCRSWGQFFLKYVVSHSGVTCAIPGMSKVAHAEDNMGANFGTLPDAAMRRRQERFFADL